MAWKVLIFKTLKITERAITLQNGGVSTPKILRGFFSYYVDWIPPPSRITSIPACTVRPVPASTLIYLERAE